MSEFFVEFAGFCLQLLFWSFILDLILGFIQRQSSAHKEEINEVLHRVNEIIHRVRVEQHGDVYYWYDDDSNDFLAQGKNLTDATAQLKSRFPGHLFFVTHKDTIYKISGPTWELEHVDIDVRSKLNS
jgi:hypothetical protein